ncbi:hypothetical protein F5I97DRAFT_1938831 [Phlebopus sp. FC_14]|nr:hypothetical protein F5I97DRAFT_1938831 [Phlebopus sp. FC_14]
MPVPAPSAESVQHRGEIARLISPLRRVRPTVSFLKLAAHRIPTLWYLYRGLLRHAERENVKFRISMIFRENQHTVSPRLTRQQLKQGHKWLRIFRKAQRGDTRLQAVLDRYDRMIAAKRLREVWKHNFRQEAAAILHKPIFTGTFIRPTVFNRILPRLRPQPAYFGGMIRWRRLARERRYEVKTRLDSWIDDLRRESQFEAELLQDNPEKKVFNDALRDWEQPILKKQSEIRESGRLDFLRLMSPYPRKLLEAGKRARRRKIANKTRERERERRGEILPATIRRMNKGPPAHILEKIIDHIVRGPGEAGYTAQMKLKLGMKLKDPHRWKLEDGLEKDQDKLNKMEEEIRTENERRRRSSLDQLDTWSAQ